MKYINKGLFIAASVSLLTLGSCSKKDMNINPNAFSEIEDPSLIIGQAEIASIMLCESNPARLAGIFSDQFTGSDRQYQSINEYIVTTGDFDDSWANIYTAGLSQTRYIIKKSQDKVLTGRAQIVEAILAGEAAALFGDVPYSKAIDAANNPSPTYDNQKDVFAAVQTLLDNAIANVGSATITGELYVNNGTKYAEVAQSLKARYYMITKEYSKAYEAAKLGITDPSKGLFARHTTTDMQQNLFYQFGYLQRGGYLTADNSHMRKMLQGEAQRMLPTPGDTVRAKSYFENVDGVWELNYSDGYFAADASFPLISGLENQLVLAEAAYRNGAEPEALTTFNNVRSFLATKYGADFPATTTTGDALLVEILEEKYVSLPGSLQVFHDLRRTNNLIGVPVKGSATIIPQRFLYPQTEINSNKNFPGLKDLFDKTPVNM